MRNILKKLIIWAMSDKDNNTNPLGSVVKADVSVEQRPRPNINLSITNAVGGKVIIARQYNSVTDRQTENTYVLHHDSDLAVELAHIITMENLQR